MLPVALMLPNEFTLPPMTLPVTDATVALMLLPDTLPAVLIIPVPANTLPPVTLPVVLIADVELMADITLPLRLNPTAFT